jgi:hypothetical protein
MTNDAAVDRQVATPGAPKISRMLEEDRKRAGWSVEQTAWRLGVSVREYRELEARGLLP